MQAFKKIKVCLLSRFFDLKKMGGGIDRYSFEIKKRFEERGIEVKEVKQGRLLFSYQSGVEYMLYTLFFIRFKIPKDCQIYHSLSPMESIYLKKGANNIVTFHDLIPVLYYDLIPRHFRPADSLFRKIIYPLNFLKRRILRKINQDYFRFGYHQAIKKAKKIIAVSNQTKKELIEYFNVPPSKIAVIYPGVASFLKPKPKRDRVYRIGSLSYLSPRKRIDVLIRSFKKTRIDGELLIAGRGEDEKRLKRMADGDKRIKFLGFVPDEKLSDFYSLLDVFVFPSSLEGFGIPIVEAMLFKIPVITLTDSIIPEDLKQKTQVVEKDALSSVLKNRDFKCNIEANYKFASGLTWENTVEKIIKIYKEILSS